MVKKFVKTWTTGASEHVQRAAIRIFASCSVEVFQHYIWGMRPKVLLWSCNIETGLASQAANCKIEIQEVGTRKALAKVNCYQHPMDTLWMDNTRLLVAWTSVGTWSGPNMNKPLYLTVSKSKVEDSSLLNLATHKCKQGVIIWKPVSINSLNLRSKLLCCAMFVNNTLKRSFREHT